MVEKITIPEIQRMKAEGKKITTFTSYDFETARIMDRAGAEMILVGDSGGKYLLGHEEFNYMTMEEEILLTRSVRRGTKHALVVGDMPFMSYQLSIEEAVRNAGRLVKEAGADVIKLEGGEEFAPHIQAVVKAGIPVMGHMGFSPQTAMALGGYLSADAVASEEQFRKDALALQAAGAFCIVFTRVPPPIAATLTRELRVPTLAGGGSGDDCDGQVCVIHNVFGMTVEELDSPKSAYGGLARPLFEAATSFMADVRAGKPVRSKREAS